MTFPIGYHDLHPDVSMNFQMNRLYGSVGEPDMLEEMRMAFRQFETADVSASITQDVLLLAGAKTTTSGSNSGTPRQECSRTRAR